jgi:alkyl sulfatase BDS1-like metallo-beta-lactamase superfamily hydrolase
MPESLLERSSRFIDDGAYEGPAANNPMDLRLEEVGDGMAVVCAFSHVWVLDSGDGLILFDTSLETFGRPAVESLRGWTTEPVDTIVYTHGHVDHVGGTAAFLADGAGRGYRPPTVVAHENVPTRFDRYDRTNGYNTAINRRQFGWDGAFFSDWVQPDTTYRSDLAVDVGELHLELRHDRGETDDHTWVWVPERNAVLTGDLLIWVFPNAGNPQKVQRYPDEWAAALRSMAARRPELLLPAHGLPITGADRISAVLGNMADALEGLVRDTLTMMNEGTRLDDIIASVRVPPALLDLPYLRPTYDEPEFVVRNIWRMYGGWYDGNPARLKPPTDASLAAGVASLVGGPGELAARAAETADGGDLRLACQLAEWAGQAAPNSPAVHATRADVYGRRRSEELSLMAKGIFGTAAADSDAIVAAES